MNIVETYSHFNGLEYLKVHRLRLWEEINKVILSVNADDCNVKDSDDKTYIGYNSIALNASFKKLLVCFGWQGCEEEPLFSHSRTNFIKERVAIDIQLDKNCHITPFLFANHLAFYIGDQIDVGIEILPMKSLQIQMSSGVPYYEGELYNVIRQGRGVPAVPLVIVGIMP
ncbi:MAG TPA: BglII/BstYI family type II restriction endonuclease [bacterium]